MHNRNFKLTARHVASAWERARAAFHAALAVAATAVATSATLPAFAADLRVAQGGSETVSANAEYDAIVVNGNLTIAPNVTVTCATLVVADN
ncbi:MAG: hypothetical protein IKO40_03635, partial [Kiritimatiellae bacterium]|nr:hypothetical protein [Kiritimatiellia bacterium]